MSITSNNDTGFGSLVFSKPFNHTEAGYSYNGLPWVKNFGDLNSDWRIEVDILVSPNLPNNMAVGDYVDIGFIVASRTSDNYVPLYFTRDFGFLFNDGVLRNMFYSIDDEGFYVTQETVASSATLVAEYTKDSNQIEVFAEANGNTFPLTTMDTSDWPKLEDDLALALYAEYYDAEVTAEATSILDFDNGGSVQASNYWRFDNLSMNQVDPNANTADSTGLGWMYHAGDGWFYSVSLNNWFFALGVEDGTIWYKPNGNDWDYFK